MIDTLNHPQPSSRHTVHNGATFGHWTVLAKGYPKSLCRCSCGVEKEVRNDSLGKTSLSCGHAVAPDQALVGSVFGELTVISMERITEGTLTALCECSCGAQVRVLKANLPRTTTCGHWKRTSMKSLEQEHPSVSVDDIKRLRAVWFSMRKRCGLPGSPSYDRYGARGIYVCEAWEALAEFVRWALQHGYSRGLTLDRIDNNGPYSPENCRWATDFEQARNKRTNRWVTAWGEEKVMTDWLSDPRCQVKRSCLKARLDNGWGPEEAISTPPRGVRLRDKPLGH